MRTRKPKKPNYIYDEILGAYIYVGSTRKVPQRTHIRYDGYNGSEYHCVEVERRIEFEDKRYLKIIKEKK